VGILIAAAGIAWWQLSGGPPAPGVSDQVVRVCLKCGNKFLAPATDPKAGPPACPKDGGTTVVARLFVCPKGHTFVGYLEKKADPAAAKTEDPYAAHMPLLLRPGLDTEWTAGGGGQSPVCPECQMPMQGPVSDVSNVKLDEVKMGELPQAEATK
jgi:hypothetical protein